MTFAWPQMLWLLAVVAPLLGWFLVWTWRQRQRQIARFVQSRLLAQLTVGVSRIRQKARLVLMAAAVSLILLALARPLYGFALEEVHRRGLDILVAIDTSRSMLAADVAPNRITRARLAALDLMKLAPTDRLGLIAFAGNAFLQCPLTLDEGAFQQSLDLVEVGLLPQGGTALGEAIDVALAAMKESGDNHKVLVILTDGEDHDSGALNAADKAAGKGLKIFTVGVGTATGERIRIVDERGRTRYVTDENNQPVVSRLNVDLLRQIAERTGGDFMPLMGTNPMQDLYRARLAPLPKGDLETRQFRRYHERFQWPLGLALLLLFIERLIPDRRRVPRTETITTATNPELRRLVGVLAAAFFTVAAQASGGGAKRDYEAGRFAEAQKEYQRLLGKQPQDPRLRFNAGTAAYQAGDLRQATNALAGAVESTDPRLLARAYYNLGNAHYRLGEQAGAPPLTLTNWQQALRHFESALQLDPQDGDAQFNREFVSRKLEELKQQMQQQQQNQSQSQSEDQKQNQTDPQKSQSDQAQSSKEESKPETSQQDQDPESASSQPEPKQEEKPPPDASSANQQPPSQPDAAEPPQPKDAPGSPDPAKAGEKPEKPRDAGEAGEAGDAGQDAKEAEAAAAAAAALGQMTPEQARQVLESARGEERVWQLVPPREPRKPGRLLRDW